MSRRAAPSLLAAALLAGCMSRAAGDAAGARVGALSVAFERLEQGARDAAAQNAAALDRIRLAGDRLDEALAPLRAEAEARAAGLAAARADLAVLTEAARQARDEMERADRLAAAVRDATPQGCAPAREALFRYLTEARLRGGEEPELRVGVGRVCLAEGEVAEGAALMPADVPGTRGAAARAELAPGEHFAVRVANLLSDRQCGAALNTWHESADITGLSQAGSDALGALGAGACRWRMVTETHQGTGGRLRCNDGTISPGCRCPGWQGCCSHHGGVAGCD